MSKRSVRDEKIERLKAKMQRAIKLQEQLDRFWQSLDDLPGIPVLDADPPVIDARGEPDFSTMDLTEAVVEVVKMKSPHPVEKHQVRREMAARGLDRDAKAVGNALYRAGQKGLIHKHGTLHWGATPPRQKVVRKKVAKPRRGNHETQKEAVTRVLREANRPLNARKIAQILLNEGVVSDALSFTTSVSSILSRLAKAGEVKRIGKARWIGLVPDQDGPENGT